MSTGADDISMEEELIDVDGGDIDEVKSALTAVSGDRHAVSPRVFRQRNTRCHHQVQLYRKTYSLHRKVDKLGAQSVFRKR